LQGVAGKGLSRARPLAFHPGTGKGLASTNAGYKDPLERQEKAPFPVQAVRPKKRKEAISKGGLRPG